MNMLRAPTPLRALLTLHTTRKICIVPTSSTRIILQSSRMMHTQPFPIALCSEKLVTLSTLDLSRFLVIILLPQRGQVMVFYFQGGFISLKLIILVLKLLKGDVSLVSGACLNNRLDFRIKLFDVIFKIIIALLYY